jgi:hypothetical protein
MSRFGTLSTAVLLTLILAGCYEAATEVTNYEPGVYKGQEDPLLAKQRKAEHLDKLAQRFEMVQMDR